LKKGSKDSQLELVSLDGFPGLMVSLDVAYLVLDEKGVVLNPFVLKALGSKLPWLNIRSNYIRMLRELGGGKKND
jgi:hypothetical protein